jgi:hypothetical protein
MSLLWLALYPQHPPRWRVLDPPQATRIMPPRRAHQVCSTCSHADGATSDGPAQHSASPHVSDHSPAGLPPSPAHAPGPLTAAPVWPVITRGGRVVKQVVPTDGTICYGPNRRTFSPSLSHTMLLEVIRSDARLWKTSLQRFTTTQRGRWFLAHLVRISLVASGCYAVTQHKAHLVAKGFTQ